MLLEHLFDPAIQTSESDIHVPTPSLFREERMAMLGVVEKRRHEFAVGRKCARQAMLKLGLPTIAIPVESSRAPSWPEGVVGSISHSETRCAAALARRSDGIRSVGLDIEAADPLESDLAPEICTTQECSWIERQSSGLRGVWLKVIFSAKECVFKCQYPLTSQIIGFEAVNVEFADGEFSATFTMDVLPFRTGDRLLGRFRIAAGHVVTCMALR